MKCPLLRSIALAQRRTIGAYVASRAAIGNLGKEKPLAADFVGLRISDRFVFGCGMDAKGYWRNLPEIRAMRGH